MFDHSEYVEGSVQVDVYFEEDEDVYGDVGGRVSIRNTSDYVMREIRCSPTLLNYFGWLMPLSVKTLEVLPPGSSMLYEGELWTSFYAVVVELEYYLRTPKTDRFLKGLEALAHPSRSDRATRVVEPHLTELSDRIGRGEFHIEFLLFEIPWPCDAGMHAELISRMPVHPLYVSTKEKRWYEHFPMERISSLVYLFKDKMVLVLGKDTGASLHRLRHIASRLKGLGYDPVLLKDFRDVPMQSSEEKLVTFAMLARFVVLEDSEPAGQIDELSILARNRIITAVLRERGKGGTFMQIDYEQDFGAFVRVWEYDSQELNRTVANLTRWAEATVKKREAIYDKLYPWRSA